MTSMTSEQTSAWAALLLRLALGAMYLSHGLLKVFVFTIPGTVGFFRQVGYPGWLAYLVILFEVIGGLMLILGVYARWVALAGIPILLGALTVHWPNGWVFSSQGGGWEYPLFLIVVSLAVALLGEGTLALRPSTESYQQAREAT